MQLSACFVTDAVAIGDHRTAVVLFDPDVALLDPLVDLL